MMGWLTGGWGLNPWWTAGFAVLCMAVVAVVAWLIMREWQPQRGAQPPSPRRLLDQRLATGELDGEEYARLRRLLEVDQVPDSNAARPNGLR